METCIFCAYSLKIYMKAQKHVCFHVFYPFRAHLYPPLHLAWTDEVHKSHSCMSSVICHHRSFDISHINLYLGDEFISV